MMLADSSPLVRQHSQRIPYDSSSPVYSASRAPGRMADEAGHAV